MVSFTTTALLAGVAATAVLADSSLVARQSETLNYVQNYNGNVAGFTYSEAAGTYSAKWSGSTDFVVGLGWSTGAERYATTIFPQ